jgi:hypothetical protein
MPRKKPTIDSLLEDWTVDVIDDSEAPLLLEERKGLQGWHGVTNADSGSYIAYFEKETDAFRFRLDCINRILNP